MSDIATSYDEVPYDSKPLFSTHPDCLCTAGRPRAVCPAPALGTPARRPAPPAAPASQCRVLELGCATGGNLIPMAHSLPESRFVGIDLSRRQIADGQAVVDTLGLRNIE